MITVSFDDTTAGPDDLPLLRIADAANRIHGMDARRLPGLLESSWLDWAPPSSRLPDVGMPSPPGRDDWLWARGHADRPRHFAFGPALWLGPMVAAVVATAG